MRRTIGSGVGVVVVVVVVVVVDVVVDDVVVVVVVVVVRCAGAAGGGLIRRVAGAGLPTKGAGLVEVDADHRTSPPYPPCTGRRAVFALPDIGPPHPPGTISGVESWHSR